MDKPSATLDREKRDVVLKPLPESQRVLIKSLTEKARENWKRLQDEQIVIRLQFTYRFDAC